MILSSVFAGSLPEFCDIIRPILNSVTKRRQSPCSWNHSHTSPRPSLIVSTIPAITRFVLAFFSKALGPPVCMAKAQPVQDRIGKLFLPSRASADATVVAVFKLFSFLFYR